MDFTVNILFSYLLPEGRVPSLKYLMISPYSSSPPDSRFSFRFSTRVSDLVGIRIGSRTRTRMTSRFTQFCSYLGDGEQVFVREVVPNRVLGCSFLQPGQKVHILVPQSRFHLNLILEFL